MNGYVLKRWLVPGLFTVMSLICQAADSAKSSQAEWDTTGWAQVLASADYVEVAKNYADFMIEYGRDVYGKTHSPLFITGMDRHTGKKISPPFAHVKRKPFMPGWERDRELRSSDRNNGNADPLDQLSLLQLMHRLTELTGDKHYAEEADKTAAWWLANCQTPIGLYPWGTHASWDVNSERGGPWFEFNRPWPYWNLNPEALQKYAMGLWDHYIYDKETGDFNRHANAYKHAPLQGMEFPWPGSAMIATWVEAYLANPDPEYVRAINTVLKRWESLRDENGQLAPCSAYGEWAWYDGYMTAANWLDDWADQIEKKEPALAERMRDYGRKNDAAYLKVADNLLNVKGFGPVKSYMRATGGFDPERLDIIGGPWQDLKDYAGFAVGLHERMKRNNSPELQARYRRAVLDTAEVYMSINPEVQWSVWGANMANAIELMLAAYDLTGNSAYLHRADQFGRLALALFLDEASPLPKMTSQDDFYEIQRADDSPSDLWMLAILELHERLAAQTGNDTQPASFVVDDHVSALPDTDIQGAPAEVWRKGMEVALAAKQGGVWDCRQLEKSAASISLNYGENGSKALFLSQREAGFTAKQESRGFFNKSAGSEGLAVDALELIASDVINKIPTLAEVEPFNGEHRKGFSGKHREPSTAEYGGFKDVLDQAGLLLVNHGKETAEVTVTVTLHDSWDDRETKDYTVTVQPGAKVLVACESPPKRFIRRLDLKSSVPGAVKLEQFAFAMTPRSKLNPLTAEPVDLPTLFGNTEAKLITEGLVLELTGAALKELPEGSTVTEWKSLAGPNLVAGAHAQNSPKIARADDRTVLRFDGRDDFLSIPDQDALDLDAWTLIAAVNPSQGNGVLIGKIDGGNAMMNYRLQFGRGGNVSVVVRGSSAGQQVNREVKGDLAGRFSVIAARFDPTANGVDQVSITVNGKPASYGYQDAKGRLTTITHNQPLLIGCQPGAEPRYFKGDVAGILLYNRALSDEEQRSAARWLLEQEQ